MAEMRERAAAPRATGRGDHSGRWRRPRARHAARHDRRGRRELERAIGGLPTPNGALIEDATLIRSEIERCRAILNRLAADSGERRGEAPEEVDLPQVVADIVRGLPPLYQDRLRIEPGSGRGLSVSRGALVQVAQSLLRNAFEAGTGRSRSGLSRAPPRSPCGWKTKAAGMSQLLARVGEPFFSTKPPGQGLGLGLFIAKNLAEQMGDGCTWSPVRARGPGPSQSTPSTRGPSLRNQKPKPSRGSRSWLAS